MRELEKIVLEGVRYIIWDERHGKSPLKSGMALLLSDRDGIGADVLIVLPKNRPLSFSAYNKNGQTIDMDNNARRAVSLTLQKTEALSVGTQIAAEGENIDRIEVRLTDSFCGRLFNSEKKSRIAG